MDRKHYNFVAGRFYRLPVAHHLDRSAKPVRFAPSRVWPACASVCGVVRHVGCYLDWPRRSGHGTAAQQSAQSGTVVGLGGRAFFAGLWRVCAVAHGDGNRRQCGDGQHTGCTARLAGCTDHAGGDYLAQPACVSGHGGVGRLYRRAARGEFEMDLCAGCSLCQPGLVWNAELCCATHACCVCQAHGMAGAGWCDRPDDAGAGVVGVARTAQHLLRIEPQVLTNKKARGKRHGLFCKQHWGFSPGEPTLPAASTGWPKFGSCRFRRFCGSPLRCTPHCHLIGHGSSEA